MRDMPQARAVRLPVLAWPAAVAAIAAVPLVVVLASGRSLVWGDTSRLFAPVRGLVIEALREGRLPLWNPYEGFGVPLFAQQLHGVLHPISVAAAWLAPRGGMDLLIVAYVVVAALGAFLLARGVGASPTAAAMAGVAYGLSGYLVSVGYVLQYLGAASTAPWTLLTLHHAGRGARLGIPLASFAVAVQVFAGDPQWLIVAATLGSLLAWSSGGLRGLGRSVLGGLLGAVIGAVQLAPALSYFREADRSAGLAELDRFQWALAPARLIELALPGLFNGRPGDPEAPIFQWLGGTSQYTTPFVPSVFVGIGVLWLAVRGIRASPIARRLAIASAVLLWLALGPALGASQLLHAVPVWGAFRYPEKLVGPLTLCLAVLAANGVDRLVPRARCAAIASLLAGALALGASALLWPGALDLLFAVGARAATAEIRHRIVVGLGHGALGAGLFAAALALGARLRWSARFPSLALAAVALASLAALPFAIHAGARPARDDRVLEVVRHSDPLARIGTPVPAGSGPANLDHWDRVAWAEARMGLPCHAIDARITNVDAYSGVLPIRYMLVAGALGERFGSASLVASRRLGVSHVVLGPTWTSDVEERARTAIQGGRLLYRDEWGVSVWQVPHRPWASFASAVVPAADALEAHRLLVELIASGRPEVVLEGPVPPSFAPGQVLSMERGTERAVVEAESTGPGLLVVNDAWAPGWSATLDGRPVPLYAADAVVRAVAWPAGRHVLEMRYDPPEVHLGAWISVAGLLAAALLAFREVRSRCHAGEAG